MNYAAKLFKTKAMMWAVLLVSAFVLLIPALQAQAATSTVSSDPFGVEGTEEAFAGTLAPEGGSDLDLVDTIANLINIALSLLGILAVIIVLIGGFKWMTAGGNDEKVGEARKLLFAGVIGLAIILAAWAIAKFVITSLQGAIFAE